MPPIAYRSQILGVGAAGVRIASWRAYLSPKSIAAKLMVVVSCALLTVLGLAIQTFLFAVSSLETADRVYRDGFLEIVLASKLSSAVDNHRRIVESAPAEVNREVLSKEPRQIDALGNHLQELLAESRITISPPTEATDSIARDVALMAHLGLQINEYAQNFAIDIAKESVAEYHTYARRVSEHIAHYHTFQVAQAEQAFRTLKAEAVRLIWLVALGFGATFLVIAPFGMLVVRGMLTRLKTIHRSIYQLSRGYLDIDVPFTATRDEIGDLARSLNVLLANAKALVENKSELAKRNAELAQLSSTLEQRVHERTTEASEAASRAEHIANKLLNEIVAKSRIEEDLRAANMELISATRAKSQFLANISHEIRTPIMGVLGMSDLLLKGSLAKQQRHFAETIAKSAEILLGIVNDILDLSRMDAGKLVLDSHELALDGFIGDVVQVSAASANSKKLRLDAIIDTDAPQRIVGDSVRLRQILLNLVSNAIKFTASGGVTIRVGVENTSGPGRVLAISVRDTGIGISPEQQSRLFNAFAQADPSITRKFGGTGLGLVICKNLIEMMGGSIGIDSRHGIGTEVAFRIPLILPPPATEPAPRPLAGKRIDYIADTDIGCESLRKRLARLGASASEHATSEAAIAALLDERTPPPDAIVVGTATAEADAHRIHVALTAAGRKTRILAVVPDQHPEAAADDAVQYLPSPALGRDIIAAVASHRGEQMIRPALPQATTEEARANGAPPTGPRVLVAEDNPINQEVISEYLSALGCRATLVENGEMAVQSYETNAFDIILLDCQMPRMDGYLAARRIRQIEAESRRARLPIVAITANTFDSDRQKCIASGMDAILSKPFTQEELARGLAERLPPGTFAGDGGADSCVLSTAHAAPADLPSAPAPDVSAVTSAPSTSADATAPSPKESPMPSPSLSPDIAHAMALPVLDGDAVANHRTRNPRLLQRMIDLYGRHTPATLGELQRALEARDWTGVKAAAHTMKSSSRGLGAERLGALLAVLELYGRALAEAAPPHPDPNDVVELAAIVLREAEAALQALDRHREPPRRDTA